MIAVKVGVTPNMSFRLLPSTTQVFPVKVLVVFVDVIATLFTCCICRNVCTCIQYQIHPIARRCRPPLELVQVETFVNPDQANKKAMLGLWFCASYCLLLSFLHAGNVPFLLLQSLLAFSSFYLLFLSSARTTTKTPHRKRRWWRRYFCYSRYDDARSGAGVRPGSSAACAGEGQNTLFHSLLEKGPRIRWPSALAAWS